MFAFSSMLSALAEPSGETGGTTADLIAFCQLVVAAIGLGVLVYQIHLARKQLEHAVKAISHGAHSLEQGAKALEHSEIANRLSHEGIILNLRNNVSAARSALSEAKTRADADPDNEGLARSVEEKLEEFLNWMDHTCKYFRAGLLTESDYKAHYDLELKQIFDGWSRKFKPGHAFPNIEIVFKRWQDNKPSLDPEADRRLSR